MSTPTEQPAADFVPVARVRVAAREAVALLLLLAGAALLVVVALHVPWQVNVAGLAAILIAAGVTLGMSR